MPIIGVGYQSTMIFSNLQNSSSVPELNFLKYKTFYRTLFVPFLKVFVSFFQQYSPARTEIRTRVEELKN